MGARQLHPGELFGLVGDFFTQSTSSTEVQAAQKKMLIVLRPMGAGAICLKDRGDDSTLRSALERNNVRNQAAMKEMIASIEAAGGMSKSEKDFLDRRAYSEARVSWAPGPRWNVYATD